MRREWIEIQKVLDQISELEYRIVDMELKNFDSVKLVSVGYSKQQMQVNQIAREKIKNLRSTKAELNELIEKFKL